MKNAIDTGYLTNRKATLEILCHICEARIPKRSMFYFRARPAIRACVACASSAEHLPQIMAWGTRHLRGPINPGDPVSL